MALLYHETAGPEVDLSCLTGSELDDTGLQLCGEGSGFWSQRPPQVGSIISELYSAISEVSAPEEGPQLAGVPCSGELLAV